MLGCVLLGIGIWMAVDRNFLTVIIGNNLYAASIYIMLSCGALIFIFTVLGCCAVVTEDICWLAVVRIESIKWKVTVHFLRPVSHSSWGSTVQSVSCIFLKHLHGTMFFPWCRSQCFCANIGLYIFLRRSPQSFLQIIGFNIYFL